MLSRDTILQVISAACKDYHNKMRKLHEIEKTLKETEQAIISLWKYFDLCPMCRGQKEYFQRSCAEDEGEVRPCKCCGGTGRFPEHGVPELYRNRMFCSAGGDRETEGSAD